MKEPKCALTCPVWKDYHQGNTTKAIATVVCFLCAKAPSPKPPIAKENK